MVKEICSVCRKDFNTARGLLLLLNTGRDRVSGRTEREEERRGEWYKEQEGAGGRRVAHIRLTPIYFVSALIELTPSASQSPLLQLPSPRPRRVFAAFPRVSYFTFSEWPSKAQKGNAKSAHSEDIHTLTHTHTHSLSPSLSRTLSRAR